MTPLELAAVVWAYWSGSALLVLGALLLRDKLLAREAA